MWELLAENRTAVLLGHARGRWSMSYHWSKQRAHIHHYLTHAHSHHQWQLWTAVSPLLGLTLSYSVLSCRGEFFKCQLHTTHVGAVDWEPHGSSPTICAGNGDHGFGVCVPLALICPFENSELNCSSALRIWNLYFTQQISRDIGVRVFVRSCAQVILSKI